MRGRDTAVTWLIRVEMDASPVRDDDALFAGLCDTPEEKDRSSSRDIVQICTGRTQEQFGYVVAGHITEALDRVAELIRAHSGKHSTCVGHIGACS